jgi:hypothetical protein
MVAAHAYFIGALAIAIWIWVCALLALRWESFRPDGSRKIALPVSTGSTTPEKDLYEQLKYHGEGIYKDLDLFFKISLALFGGIAYITLSDSAKTNPALVRELVDWGLWLQFFAAVFTAVFVLTHKRSAILRWKTRFPWWHVFLWGETWGYVAGMAITFYAFFVVGPRLIQLLKLP